MQSTVFLIAFLIYVHNKLIVLIFYTNNNYDIIFLLPSTVAILFLALLLNYLHIVKLCNM